MLGGDYLSNSMNYMNYCSWSNVNGYGIWLKPSMCPSFESVLYILESGINFWWYNISPPFQAWQPNNGNNVQAHDIYYKVAL